MLLSMAQSTGGLRSARTDGAPRRGRPAACFDAEGRPAVGVSAVGDDVCEVRPKMLLNLYYTCTRFPLTAAVTITVVMLAAQLCRLVPASPRRLSCIYCAAHTLQASLFGDRHRTD